MKLNYGRNPLTVIGGHLPNEFFLYKDNFKREFRVFANEREPPTHNLKLKKKYDQIHQFSFTTSY